MASDTRKDGSRELIQNSLPNPGFFEGSEKLIEIWYEPCEGDQLSLRSISRSDLESLLDIARCTIIGYSRNNKVDSYVLSESSMFVFDSKFIIKTCGTTSLLPIIPKLMELAKTTCNRTQIKDFFYSHRKFTMPNEQVFPHCSFDDEVAYLDGFFDGAAFMLGNVHGEVWYLYTLDQPDAGRTCPDQLLKRPLSPRWCPVWMPVPDQTLEIIMMDLDPAAMSLYYKTDDFVSAKEITKKSTIADLLPGAHTDEFMFEPCGFSVNGVLDDAYFTIHITPQECCSYASFETNVMLTSYTELINK
eukprot:Ihof_evm10s59 gene=Ihof_evmTU10s59